MANLARVPRPVLAKYVALLWHQEIAAGQFGPELVLPSGRAELVIEVGPSIPGGAQGLVCGPHFKVFRIERPTSAHSVVGVHFLPGGIRPFLGRRGCRAASAHDSHNLVISLESIWGNEARRLHDRLLQAATAHDRLDLVERELIGRLIAPADDTDLVQRAVDLLGVTPAHRPVEHVAAQLGYSARRIQQRFQEEVGLSPKLFQRIIRFQRTLESFKTGPRVDWSQTALAHGYYDQAHLNNEFRAITGVSPSALLAQRTERPGHVHAP